VSRQLQVPESFTLETLEMDLNRTEQDYERLGIIVKNLKLFISDTDQDRRSLRPMLDTFERLQHKAFELMTKIRHVKTAVEKMSN
jgi:hypothetical protein